ncbi:hypothetical protein [Amycolatopsis cihanbeyliensis]|uniref:PH (Pleckstrin Homology) domain-containing protein n=1 Tax=Amycolatopsis cihanbeyliensis TaxID=1128664 RepID=A0A542DLZ5_AMYCI|nr:hypothetical protein [Amycolatopsis cihanbeyliensis]TQJ04005.1 PH (Pleckstrin Homology) domain-containing protein [Amycolatopsis cihanbeyliensis]
MSSGGEPVFDKRDQYEQVVSGLLDGERVLAVYDAIGAGTGFIGLTGLRVIVQDKSFVGKKTALVSLPYAKIHSVAVLSNKSWGGSFFSTSSIAITSGSHVHEVEFRGHQKAHHVHNVILWHITR